MNNFREEDHPRDVDGKFTDKDGESSKKEPIVKEPSPRQKGVVDYGLGNKEFREKSTSKKDVGFEELTDDQKEKLKNSVIAFDPKTHKPISFQNKEITEKLARIKEYAKDPTININTSDRIEMRKNMVDNYVKIFGKNAKCENKVYIVMGLAASGKSSAIANKLVAEKGGALVDADIFKEGDKSKGFQGLSEYNINGESGAGVTKVHKESSMLAKKAMKKMIEKGMNIVYPTVGAELEEPGGMLGKLQPFIDAGYEIHIAQAYVPLKRALQNDLQRYADTGRLVDPKLLMENNGKPLDVFDKLKNNPHINSMGLFRTDNDYKNGEKPKKIFIRGNEFDCIYK